MSRNDSLPLLLSFKPIERERETSLRSRRECCEKLHVVFNERLFSLLLIISGKSAWGYDVIEKSRSVISYASTVHLIEKSLFRIAGLSHFLRSEQNTFAQFFLIGRARRPSVHLVDERNLLSIVLISFVFFFASLVPWEHMCGINWMMYANETYEHAEQKQKKMTCQTQRLDLNSNAKTCDRERETCFVPERDLAGFRDVRRSNKSSTGKRIETTVQIYYKLRKIVYPLATNCNREGVWVL